jgi:tungstate transport system ATP-binding protein
MAGLIKANSGEITLAAPMRGRVGLVFQRPTLLRRTVRGNLAHALWLSRVDRAIRKDRLEELLNLAGLDKVADQPARQLSGGQAQRLAIVRALASNPALLLADEPTAHLDPQSMFAIETLFARIALTGTKVVLVSHDRGQIDRLACEVAFLHRGRCCEVTETEEFFTHAKSEEARAYLEGTLLL